MHKHIILYLTAILLIEKKILYLSLYRCYDGNYLLQFAFIKYSFPEHFFELHTLPNIQCSISIP